MKLSWIFGAVAMVGLLATAACEKTETGVGGGGGFTNTGGGTGGSGNAPPPIYCADLIADLANWDDNVAAETYEGQALWDCVCGAGTSCSLVCDDSAHPSFCAGVAPVAAGQCESCIMTGACSAEYDECLAN